MRSIMKKPISILLIVTMIVAYMPMMVFAETETVASGTCGDNMTWEIFGDGELCINGEGEMDNFLEAEDAPWYSSKELINKVTIKDGVTSVGSNAFYYYSNLKTVNLYDSVTAIGTGAFYSCPITDTCYSGTEEEWNLITIEGNNNKLKNPTRFHYSCSGCAITETRVEPTCTTEGSLTITCQNCSYNSTEILTVEHEYINGYCAKCGDREVLASGDTGEGGCTWILYGDGIMKISGKGEMGEFSPAPWDSQKEAIKEVIIEEGVTSISNSAFYGCSSLTSITIPDGVTSIGSSAFRDCSSLTSITIPDGVISIGSSAFYECSSLTSITIPDGVTSIGECTFYGCSSLTSITIPDGVTSIGDEAFSGCSSLTSIIIPDSVTSISYRMFRDCSSLLSITIPDGVTSIGGYAFDGCSSLTSITIPDSVTSIGGYAFDECSSLTSIIIPDSVTSISYGMFRDCSSLLSITIPDGVTSIGDEAFSGCSSLTSIIIPDSVTSLGDGAFIGCSSLTSITIPDSVTSIGSEVFIGCSSLTSIIIPDSVTSISYGMFRDCSSLLSITIPDSVTSIGSEAFSGCSGLKSITIPDGVISIGNYAFYECSSLTSITIPDGVTSIGHRTFRGCSSLTSITIPDAVTSIGSEAFYGCSSLTSITIPDAVTSIGSDAFYGCSSLKYVFYGGSEDDWSAIAIYSNNAKLYQATIHYNATSHTWADEWTIDIEPSCTQQGSKSQHCLYCDARINETIIPATSHTPGAAATCTEAQKCTVCGEILSDATGHDLECHEELIPTCTKSGHHAYESCKNCDFTTFEEIPATGHTPGAEATCIEPQKCTVCGEILVNVTSHTYQDVITRATLSSDGKIESKCSKCGNVSSTTTIYRPTKFTLSATTYTYDGKIKKPTVTVKNSAGKTLVKDTDYTLTYASGRKYVGRYSVKITFKGKYSGSKTLYFNINPPKTSLSSLTASSKGFTVKWAKKTTQTTGYQLQYSTSSKFKSGNKTMIVSSNKTTAKKITKLKAKKKYYVKIRTYKTVNGTRYYSGWSSVKSVTTK